MRPDITLKTLVVATSFAISSLAFAQGSGPSGQPPGGIGAGDRTAPVTGATQDRTGGAPSPSGSSANSGTNAPPMSDRGASAARQAGATNVDKSGTGTSTTTTTRTTREERRAQRAENRTARERSGVSPQVRRDEPSSPPAPGTPRARTNTADPSRTSPQ